MNEVASPCCGSCTHFYYSEIAKTYGCHNRKAVFLFGACFPADECSGNHYSPRNPIPITDLPGMSEIAHAYKAIAEAYKTDRPAPEWAIKALEAKDE